MKMKIVSVIVLFLLVVPLSSVQGQVVVVKRPVKPDVVVVKKKRPGPDYIWIEGRWRWNKKANRYVWVKPQWVKVKKNREWIPGHWKKVPGGWKWIPGHWVKHAKVKAIKRRRVR